MGLEYCMGRGVSANRLFVFPSAQRIGEIDRLFEYVADKMACTIRYNLTMTKEISRLFLDTHSQKTEDPESVAVLNLLNTPKDRAINLVDSNRLEGRVICSSGMKFSFVCNSADRTRFMSIGLNPMTPSYSDELYPSIDDVWSAFSQHIFNYFAKLNLNSIKKENI